MSRDRISDERVDQIIRALRHAQQPERKESLDQAMTPAARASDRPGSTRVYKCRSFRTEELTELLSQRVMHQSRAVEAAAKVLAVRSGVARLHPERPLAFLLATGPTGTGKTTLASAIAEVVFGDPESVLTVDCSELSTPASVSALTGPPPGYVGFTERDSWLTSRLQKLPRGVVLFDEIEKAHPDIWNLLLQIGAGRITDTSGRTANFANYTVLLTSNTGASEAVRAPVGFGAERDSGAELATAVTRTFPPELLSRIDATLLFQQLPAAANTDIAWRTWTTFRERLGQEGWSLDLDRHLLQETVAEVDMRSKGARELERAIEFDVLVGLNGLQPGSYRAVRTEDKLSWVPSDQQ